MWLGGLERWYAKRQLRKLREKCPHPLIYVEAYACPVFDVRNHPETNIAYAGLEMVTYECAECAWSRTIYQPTSMAPGARRQWINTVAGDVVK